MNVPGPTNFKDLKEVDGTICSTYTEAAYLTLPVQHYPFGAEWAETTPLVQNSTPLVQISPSIYPFGADPPSLSTLWRRSCTGRADINLILPNPE